MLGSGYRKREVRACFALMAFSALGGLVMLWTEIAGTDGRRFAGVVFGAGTSAVLASLMPFPPRDAGGAPTQLRAA